jgi:hypothetical protein
MILLSLLPSGFGVNKESKISVIEIEYETKNNHSVFCTSHTPRGGADFL